jgi:predicted RND superfamily exporter protein
VVGLTCLIIVVVVGGSFLSVGIVVRLLVTTGISLVWTFGLAVLIYQPGDAQNFFARQTPSLLSSSGLYWIIPLMSFTILVGECAFWVMRSKATSARRLASSRNAGLALDYDIFLLSRAVEYRQMGWSDRASICLAVERSSSVITAAGLIMSVSFASLLALQVRRHEFDTHPSLGPSALTVLYPTLINSCRRLC